MKVVESEYRRIDVSYKTFKAYIEETELSESLSNLLNIANNKNWRENAARPRPRFAVLTGVG